MIFVFFLIFYLPDSIFADSELLITKTIKLENEIEFDGIWTYHTEWKPTSLAEIDTEKGPIYFRFAHQDNFLYFFIDAVADKNPEKNADKAIICFDTKNDKTLLPNQDDYCFISILGKNIGHTIQGGSFISTQNYFKKIINHEDFIGVGGISNENDRYSSIPHSSYEFRIPIDLITRSNIYGFYVGVFDKSETKMYSWPESSTTHYTKIPSPSTWGSLVSPDKSLPEFNFPSLYVIVGLIGILIITQIKTKCLIRF